MTAAERFAACMAEAGFPLDDVAESPNGFVWNPILPLTVEAGIAIHRAHRLAGRPMALCEPCAGARRADPFRWNMRMHVPCEHVEVPA